MKQYCSHCGLEVEFTDYRGKQFAVLRENSHAVLRENSYAELGGNSHAELWGNSHAVLRENSHAVLRENSYAELGENSHAELGGNSHAELWGNSHAVLRENSHAVLRENSYAELGENSHAVLEGNSHAELGGNSHAVLWGNSHAVLRGNSHAVLEGKSHAECQSPYACGILRGYNAKCSGRQIGDKPLTPKEYLTYCGIEIKNQYVVLYKSVREDFSSFYSAGVKYIIGTETIAPDWDKDGKIECGKGLHLSPTIQQAITFNNNNTYLACRVKLSDIASLPAFAQYPDKIRVRACKPLYRVDKEGKKIKEPE